MSSRVDPEEHWQQLHRAANPARWVQRIKSRMNGGSLATVAGMAATGFALGAWAVTNRRATVGNRFLGALIPVGRRLATKLTRLR